MAAAALLLSTTLFAQGPGPSGEAGGVVVQGRRGGAVMIRREMGKWWENPEVVSKLQLSDAQVTQLNQAFYDHKMKLIDYGADMEKQDLKLQTMLDADQPNETQVSTQVDHVLAARGRVEREYTMMNLDLRKVLSVEQWRQLKTVRGAGMPGENLMYFHKQFRTGGPGESAPPLPPLPPPDMQ